MSVTTAMLMAAGLGTRMRPLTLTRPKPLIEVGGKAMIDWILDAIAGAGITRAVVNVHYLADQMRAHLARRTDMEILISDETGHLLETGGGLVKALPLLDEGPVLVSNTDAFWYPASSGPVRALIGAYDAARMDELLLLARRERSLGYHAAGDFSLDAEGRLERRGERPAVDFAFAGVRVVDPARYAGEPVEPFSANRIWNRSLAAGRLYGLPLEADWLHVGDPDALAAAGAHIAERVQAG